MMRLYNTAMLPLRLAAAVWGSWQILRGPRRQEWQERLGRRLPRSLPGAVWIHGSSVGEARVVSGLVSRLTAVRRDLPLAVSAYTATGRAQLPQPPRVAEAFFLPLDFPGAPTRLLLRMRPALLVLVETELWPNLLHETHRAGVPVAVVNGRLSEERMASYRRFGALYRPLLERLAVVGAQSEQDAARFRQLGVPASVVRTTGNVKYDLPTPRTDNAALRARLHLDDDRPIFVAGSTAAGEDELVLEAFRRARAVLPALFLVLAPRHPGRASEVEQLVRATGFTADRLSAGHPSGDTDVLLVDSIGLLQQLYAVSAASFVGGSLVPIGGHNVLEPAAVGAAAIFGPYTESFEEPAAELERAGGAIRVRDAGQLGDSVIELVVDAGRRDRLIEAARGVLAANRGALERNVEMLLEALDSGEARAEGSS